MNRVVARRHGHEQANADADGWGAWATQHEIAIRSELPRHFDGLLTISSAFAVPIRLRRPWEDVDGIDTDDASRPSGGDGRITWASPTGVPASIPRSVTRMMAARPIDEEFRTGWPVVFACFATAVFAWGFVSYGQPVYLAELQRTHGWSAGTIGGATTVSFVIGAGLLPWVGRAIECFGARAVLSGGAILLGAGAIGLSHAAEPWQLYPCNVVMGFGWAGVSSTAISTTLASWFEFRRGLALSLALTGASVGGFAVAPLLLTLSQRHGLGTAVPEVVLSLLAVIVPLIWIGIRWQADRGPPWSMVAATVAPRRPAITSRREALRDAQFWSVAAPFALALSAQVGTIVFQVSYLLPLLGTSGTSLALVCTSVAGVVGRFGLGLVIDRLPQRRVSVAIFASQAGALGLMIAFPTYPAALYLSSTIFGLGVGNVVILPSVIIQHEFSPMAFGAVLGLSTAIGQITYSLMPPVLGVVHDLSGGYGAVLGVCIGLQLAAALLVSRRATISPARRHSGTGQT
jgi:MFS family permease